MITSIRLLQIITYYSRFISNTRTHQKITSIIFFWSFEIVLAAQNFFLCFHRLTKPTTFALAVMIKPLIALNVLGSTLVLWLLSMTFSLALCQKILEYWSWRTLFKAQSYLKKCWCYYQSCWRSCLLHMVIKLKDKIFLFDIPLKCWKFQTIL